MSEDIIALALSEDIGGGDVTCQWFTGPDRRATARIIAKQEACLAGGDVCASVFRRVDPGLAIEVFLRDGAGVRQGDAVLEASGSAASILTAERTALNFLQRLSGVATLTRKYVEAVAGTGAVILDTRKTSPGLRTFEKAAAAAGGATNHRIGLYDMVMVKDNHLAAGTSLWEIQAAIDATKAARPSIRIEIEADTLDQARSFFQLRGVDVVLLDNMEPEVMREAVRARPAHIRLEASGGVTLDTIRRIAETGVDFISVGALTHSAPAVDFSLELQLPSAAKGSPSKGCAEPPNFK
ncbi:MAG: carboxylating nicotinate-nucleotide diphosphorylase [Verrucomicrobiae bacterium]